MRVAMLNRRVKVFADNPQAGVALCRQFSDHIILLPQSIVAGTKSFGTEIDVTPIIESLRAKGHAIALPVVAGKDEPLLFRRYAPGDPLAKTAFGMEEPLAAAPVVEPDVLLVPLLAFDRRGYRLGYGGGYYDRTIMNLRRRKKILAIGLGFAGQEVAEVPAGAGDAQLDKIVTDIQVFVINLA